MNPHRKIALSALAASVAMALPASAHDKNVLMARDVVNCMKARMKTQQSESYRDAFRACKQELELASRRSDATTAMNSTAAHPKP